MALFPFVVYLLSDCVLVVWQAEERAMNVLLLLETVCRLCDRRRREPWTCCWRRTQLMVLIFMSTWLWSVCQLMLSGLCRCGQPSSEQRRVEVVWAGAGTDANQTPWSYAVFVCYFTGQCRSVFIGSQSGSRHCSLTHSLADAGMLTRPEVSRPRPESQGQG